MAHIHDITRCGPSQLCLVFDDGAEGVTDFAPVIAQGGVFLPLSDPAFFAKAVLTDKGRVVAWPGELEFCADALRETVQMRE